MKPHVKKTGNSGNSPAAAISLHKQHSPEKQIKAEENENKKETVLDYMDSNEPKQIEQKQNHKLYFQNSGSSKKHHLRIALFFILFAGITILAFLWSNGSVYLAGGLITGDVVSNDGSFEYINVNASVIDGQEIAVGKEAVAVKINANYSGNGSARAYAVIGNNTLLIYEFNSNKAGVGATGFVIYGEDGALNGTDTVNLANDTNETNVTNVTNETSETNAADIAIEDSLAIENNQSNETNASNETAPVIPEIIPEQEVAQETQRQADVQDAEAVSIVLGCEETCSLVPSMIDSVYFELDGGKLFVESISYSPADSAVYFAENISDIYLNVGTYKKINLQDYFSGTPQYSDMSSSEGYDYETNDADNSIMITGLSEGVWPAKVYAVAGESIIESNTFNVIVNNSLNIIFDNILDENADAVSENATQQDGNETGNGTIPAENLTGEIPALNESGNVSLNNSIPKENLTDIPFKISGQIKQIIAENNDSPTIPLRVIVKYKEGTSPVPIESFLEQKKQESEQFLSQQNTDIELLQQQLDAVQSEQQAMIPQEQIESSPLIETNTNPFSEAVYSSEAAATNQEAADLSRQIEEIKAAEEIVAAPDIISKESVPDAGIEAVIMDVASLDVLKDNKDIEMIYLDNEVSSLAEESLDLMHYDEAVDFALQNLSLALDGAGVKICLLDTGINQSIVQNNAIGYNFIDDTSDYEDDNGHGTSVGYILYRMVPQADLIVAKVLNNNSTGYESTIIAGLQYCSEQGADIISMSLGSGGYNGYCNSNPVSEVVNDLVSNGTLVVAATGNDGSDLVKVPACASGALAVGASTKNDSLASLTSFNGNTLLLAPGSSVTTFDDEGNEAVKSGTSMAVPFVSALGAMLMQSEPALSPSGLAERIIHTGQLIDSGNHTFSRADAYSAIINNISNNLTPEGNNGMGNDSEMYAGESWYCEGWMGPGVCSGSIVNGPYYYTGSGSACLTWCTSQNNAGTSCCYYDGDADECSTWDGESGWGGGDIYDESGRCGINDGDMTCLQGNDCWDSNSCVEGTCNYCSVYGASYAYGCSDGSDTWSTSYGGICAKTFGGSVVCATWEIAWDGSYFYNGCYYANPGNECDADIDNTGYGAGYTRDGTCVYNSGSPMCCNSDNILSGEVAGGVNWADSDSSCGVCTSDGQICDSSPSTGPSSDGMCVSSACRGSGLACYHGGSYLNSGCSNGDACDSNIDTSGYSRTGYMCSGSCVADGSVGGGGACCQNENCAGGISCSGGVCGKANGVACSSSAECVSSNCRKAINSGSYYCAAAAKECSYSGGNGYDTGEIVNPYICTGSDASTACSTACQTVLSNTYYCDGAGSWGAGGGSGVSVTGCSSYACSSGTIRTRQACNGAGSCTYQDAAASDCSGSCTDYCSSGSCTNQGAGSANTAGGTCCDSDANCANGYFCVNSGYGVDENAKNNPTADGNSEAAAVQMGASRTCEPAKTLNRGNEIYSGTGYNLNTMYSRTQSYGPDIDWWQLSGDSPVTAKVSYTTGDTDLCFSYVYDPCTGSNGPLTYKNGAGTTGSLGSMNQGFSNGAGCSWNAYWIAFSGGIYGDTAGKNVLGASNGYMGVSLYSAGDYLRQWYFGWLKGPAGAVAGTSYYQCCKSSTDCVDDAAAQGPAASAYGACYANAATRETGGGDGADIEYCSSGTWLAADASSTACSAASGSWNYRAGEITGGYSDTTTPECCGDDANEGVKSFFEYGGSDHGTMAWGGSQTACCSTTTDQVNSLSMCATSGASVVDTGSTTKDKWAFPYYNTVADQGWLDCDGHSTWVSPFCGGTVCATNAFIPFGEGGTTGAVGNMESCGNAAGGTNDCYDEPGYTSYGCCGDDVGENYRTAEVASTGSPTGMTFGDQRDTVCCDALADCVYNGACYTSSPALWSGVNYAISAGDNNYVRCLHSTGEIGRWYNVDHYTSYCAASGFHWNVGHGDANSDTAYTGTPQPAPDYCATATTQRSIYCCCGDDVNENYLSGFGGAVACCDAATDCVTSDGTCISSGSHAIYNGAEYYCNAGTWNLSTYAPPDYEVIPGASQGIIGYWDFNEGSGTTVFDKTDRQAGTITGATYCAGYSGTGLSFDGNDDVMIENGTKMAAGTFTISMWVKTSTNAMQYLVTRRFWSQSIWEPVNYRLDINASGQMRFIYVVGTDIANVNGFGPKINNGQWHQIAVTHNGSHVTFFVDGVNTTAPQTAPYGSPDELSTISALHLGRDIYSAGNQYVGQMDEVQIYDRALSMTEMYELYNGAAAKKIAFYENDPNLLVYLPFEETSGNVTHDYSWNNKDATIYSATRVSGAAKFGGALNFNSAGSNYVRVPASALSSISSTGEITISLWQYGSASQPLDESIFHAEDGSGNRVLNMHIPWSNSIVYWDAGYTDTYDRLTYTTTSASQTEGQWNNWAFTKSTSTGIMKIYFNGNAVASSTGNTRAFPAINSVEVGSGAAGNYYDGMIDEVRVYNRALSDSEVTDLYLTGKPNIEVLRSTSQSGTYSTVMQEVQNYNAETGTTANWTGWTGVTSSGPYEGSYSFTKTGDGSYGDLWSDTMVAIDPDKNYTLSGYFKSVGAGGLSSFYYGFVPYDKDKRQIQNININVYGSGTYATLYNSTGPSDSVIYISDTGGTKCSEWQTANASNYYSIIAFGADDSGSFLDLPNYNLAWISTSVTDNGVYCTIPLTGAHGFTFAGGSKIRMHSAGASYMYSAAAGATIPNSWTRYAVNMKGTNLYGADYSSSFWPGTRYVKILLLTNVLQGATYTMLGDNLTIVADNGATDKSFYVTDALATDTTAPGTVSALADGAATNVTWSKTTKVNFTWGSASDTGTTYYYKAKAYGNAYTTLGNELLARGFESGLQLPFTSANVASTFATTSSQCFSGVYSLQHTATAGDSYTIPYGDSTATVMYANLHPTTVTFSVNAKSSGAVNAEMYIFCLDSGYGYAAFDYASKTLSSSWASYSYTYTCPAGTSYISVRLDNEAGAGGTIYWDNPTLYEVKNSTVVSGIDGYAVACDQSASTTPAGKDIESTESGYNCTFSSGTNYFHIASIDNEGNTGSAYHSGAYWVCTDSDGIVDSDNDGLSLSDAGDTCACSAADAQTPDDCDPGVDGTPNGLCVLVNNGGTYDCETDGSEICYGGTYYENDCTYCSYGSSCDSNGGTSYSATGVCAGASNADCNAGPIASDSTTSITASSQLGADATVCGASYVGNYCDTITDGAFSTGNYIRCAKGGETNPFGAYAAGTNYGCCGNDAGENFRNATCLSSCTSNVTDRACCNTATDCVWSGTCYAAIAGMTAPWNSNQVVACSVSNWSLVDDCSTKTSADTDGGDKPYTAGTVTDYTTSGGASCNSNAYADACLAGGQNLTEYYNTTSTYASKLYNCSQFELAASDPDGGDNVAVAGTCSAGVGVSCNNGAFTNNTGSGGTDGKTGTCGTGIDTCNYTEYYPVDSSDNCTGLDTCMATTHDCDEHLTACTACVAATSWLKGGETGFGEYTDTTTSECCGDDSGENTRTRIANTSMDNGYVTNTSDGACCNAATDCVDDAVCFTTLSINRDADADGDNDYCNAGTWYDCNSSTECGTGYYCSSNDCLQSIVNVAFTDPTPPDNWRGTTHTIFVNVSVSSSGYNVAGCFLELNSTQNITMQMIGSGTSVTCNITGDLVDGGTYTYKVYANNTAGVLGNTSPRTIVENTAPLLGSVLLQSTTAKNFTGENLSLSFTASDAETDPISNFSDFRRNGTSIAVVNMPFDVNVSSTSAGAVTDYSTYGNNGTLGAGNAGYAPTWNTSGMVGGSYTFYGDDYIQIQSMTAVNGITASAWILPYSVSSKTLYSIGSQSGVAGYHWLYFSGAGTINWQYANGSSPRTSSFATTIPLNTPTFITITHDYSTNVVKFYVNGTLKQTTSNTDPVLSISGKYVRIGAYAFNNMPFTGNIDEAKIYDKVLSPEQIYQEYAAGINGDSVNVLVSNETNETDNWTALAGACDGYECTTGVSNQLIVISSDLSTCNPPASGNWFVNGSETCDDEIIYIRGNISIDNGDVLTLNNVTLYMNTTADTQTNITITGGGILRTNNSRLFTNASFTNYLWVQNGTFNATNTNTSATYMHVLLRAGGKMYIEGSRMNGYFSPYFENGCNANVTDFRANTMISGKVISGENDCMVLNMSSSLINSIYSAAFGTGYSNASIIRSPVGLFYIYNTNTSVLNVINSTVAQLYYYNQNYGQGVVNITGWKPRNYFNGSINTSGGGRLQFNNSNITTYFHLYSYLASNIDDCQMYYYYPQASATDNISDSIVTYRTIAYANSKLRIENTSFQGTNYMRIYGGAVLNFTQPAATSKINLLYLVDAGTRYIHGYVNFTGGINTWTGGMLVNRFFPVNVTDESGFAIPGATVNLANASGSVKSSAVTGANGIAVVNMTDDDNTTIYQLLLGTNFQENITMLEPTAPYGINITVLKPSVSATDLEPATPVDSQDLIANVTCTDSVYNPVAVYWKVYKNNAEQVSEAGSSSITQGQNVNVKNISNTLTSVGESWKVQFTCQNDYVNGTAVNTSSVTIVPTACGMPFSSNTVYTASTDISITDANCLNIDKANITLDCNSHSITGNYADGTAGIYVNSTNVTIKNCIIQSFNRDVELNGASSPTIMNVTFRTPIGLLVNNTLGGIYKNLTFSNITENGIYVTNNAHNNSFTNISISANDGNGIYVDGGSNNTFDCAGGTISGTNMSYGIYSNQYNTSIRNCNILTFFTGILMGGERGLVSSTNITISHSSGFGINVTSGNLSTITNSRVNSTWVGIHAAARSLNLLFANSTVYGSTQGIYLMGNSDNSVISNCSVSALNSQGLRLESVANITVNRTVSYSAGSIGIYLYKVNSSRIIESQGSSGTSRGIVLIYVNDSSVLNSIANASAARGMSLESSINNTITNVNISGKDAAYGALHITTNAKSNTIANCSINGLSGNVTVGLISGSNANNRFINNSIFNATHLLFIDFASGNNTFYYNNFSSGTTYYVNNSNSTNLFNTTNSSGSGIGNTYETINTIRIYDTNGDGWGDAGWDYPVNSSNYNKWSGYGTDFAPATTQLWPTTNSFSATWNTSATSAGSSNASQIMLPLEATGTYYFYVQWGDGTSGVVTSYDDPDANHSYSTPGIKSINLSGTIVGFRFNNGGDKLKIMNITRWGDLRVGNSGGYFFGCSSMNFTGTDNLNLTGTRNLSYMFWSAGNFSGNISGWDVSNVTEMTAMLGNSRFNGDISRWNVANVTTFLAMFMGNSEFNQNISGWNTAKVTSMQQMFYNAAKFNQNLTGWNTGNVTTMKMMFHGASLFNGNISSWNTIKVTDMADMFDGATSFNQDIGGWNVGNVTTFYVMFQMATAFNKNLSNWNTAAVTDMYGMFNLASSFNGDISGWNTGNVTTMYAMFQAATAFNSNISNWTTSKVTSMKYMFDRASAFNQAIGNWDVGNVADMDIMFSQATSFNQNIGKWNVSNVTSAAQMFQSVTLSTSNYDALLQGWGSRVEKNGTVFSGGNSKYTAAGISGRDNLTNLYNWTITDGGINNVAPVMVTASILPSPANTTDTLRGWCNATDANGDNVTYFYQWYRNGVLNASGSSSSLAQNVSRNINNLSAGLQSKWEVWIFSCLANDSYLNSSWLNSTGLNISNSPPSNVSLVYPGNGNDTFTNRTPRFTWTTATDADGDTLTYTINVSTSSAFSDSVYSKSGISTLYQDYDLPSEMAFGTYYWKVVANDGTTNGSYSSTFNFTLVSSVNVQMVVGNVTFAALAPGLSNNTLSNNPQPFVIKSLSNTYVDMVNFNVSKSLWDRVGLNTSYWQMKARTKGDGSYNESGSKTTFFNVTNTTYVVRYLNYTSVRNNVSLDVNVTAPMYEGPGEKTSTIGFYFEVAS